MHVTSTSTSRRDAVASEKVSLTHAPSTEHRVDLSHANQFSRSCVFMHTRLGTCPCQCLLSTPHACYLTSVFHFTHRRKPRALILSWVGLLFFVCDATNDDLIDFRCVLRDMITQVNVFHMAEQIGRSNKVTVAFSVRLARVRYAHQTFKWPFPRTAHGKRGQTYTHTHH